MTSHEKTRRAIVWCIVLVAILAATWSAAMLVGGLRAAGQLDSQWNPLGENVALVAAAAIVGGTSLFYYMLGSRRRMNKPLLMVSGGLVLALTVFASATQLVLVTDAATGAQYMKGTEVTVDQAWQQARRIDRRIVSQYRAQVAFYESRMQEEARTGKGERYRKARDTRNQLRESYGSVLGSTAQRAPQGQSLNDDIAGVQSYIRALENKAEIYDRMARDIGITAEDFRGELDAISASLDGIGADGWIDRRSLIYAATMQKIGEMLTSFGMSNVGFSLSVLLSIAPDLIQILCVALLYFLRPEDGEGTVKSRDGELLDDNIPWDVSDEWDGSPAWGHTPTSSDVH